MPFITKNGKRIFVEGFHHKRMVKMSEDFRNEEKELEHIKMIRERQGLPSKTPALEHRMIPNNNTKEKEARSRFRKIG